MSSAGKINANRANARASRGPKTAQGRGRSARNARRHGLSLPVLSDRALSDEVEALACEIAGTGAPPEMNELARRIVEAQVDLRRVRSARHDLLSGALCDPDYDAPAAKWKKSKVAVEATKLRARLELSPRLRSMPLISQLLTRPGGVCAVVPRGAAEIRDHSFRHDSAACGHGSLRTTCVVAAQVCDPGSGCGMKASRQRG